VQPAAERIARCCPASGTSTGHQGLATFDQPERGCGMSRKTRPMKCPVRGASNGHPAAPAFRRERARRRSRSARPPWTSWERPQQGRADSRSVRAMRRRATSQSGRSVGRPERLPDQHVRMAPARRGKARAAILLSALGGSLAVQMKMLVPQRKQDGRQFRLARGMQYAAPAPVVLSLLVRSGDEISGDSGYRSPRESARRSFLPSARRREVASAITMSARSGVRICSGPVLSAVRADRAPAQHPRGRPR
jgi:hypothetical protein